MMTHSTHTRRWGAALAAAAVLLLCIGPTSAGDGNLTSLSGGGSGTSGTLPSKSNGHGGLPIGPAIPPTTAMLLEPAKPAITLTGLEAELNQVIADAHGAGWYRMTPLAAGELTITYYGDVVLDLNEGALLASGVTAALAIAPGFHGGTATVRVSGLERSTQVLRTGNQNVQLRRMLRAGLVERGVGVRAFSPGRTSSSAHSFGYAAGGVRIVQTH